MKLHGVIENSSYQGSRQLKLLRKNISYREVYIQSKRIITEEYLVQKERLKDL